MICELCKAREATERPELVPLLKKGIPMQNLRIDTCEQCTAGGFSVLVAQLHAQVIDLPRRREILKLNEELKTLTNPEEIEENRKRKSELVLAGKR